RNKVKHWLVLLSRIFAIIGLVLAFAQPFIPQGDEVKKGEKAISLFVDNSYSMSSLSADIPLLEKAKKRATEIVEAYSVEDRFQILTHDFEGRHQRLVSKEDALSLIEEIQITPAARELSKVVSRQKQVLNNSNVENRTSYIISDFQKNITDVLEEKDTIIDFNLVPLQSVKKQNISIDSAWFMSPVQMLNQNNPLLVKVRNISDEKAENIRLELNHKGQSKPVGTLNIPAQSEVIDTVNITVLKPGWHEADLSITDYPVQFDDKLYFTFNVPDKINILVINSGRKNKYLDAVFSGISLFNIKNVQSSNLDYSEFSNYNLIVLNLKTLNSKSEEYSLNLILQWLRHSQRVLFKLFSLKFLPSFLE
ncbi:MAG: BatA domain-containing protein, partial [Saprospiraceae bacterium]